MLPALFPTLLASVPTGPGAALAITAAALTYVITQARDRREVDHPLSAAPAIQSLPFLPILAPVVRA